MLYLAKRAYLFDVLFSTLRKQLDPRLRRGPTHLQAYVRVLSDIKISLVPEAAVYLVTRSTPLAAIVDQYQVWR